MRLSGTSMATPVVSGAAALLLQANPKLTPNMVKMILMYTAQPIKGANMLEQGTGQLNIEGAVRLAKQIRTDLNWATTPLGTRMLKTTTLPTPQNHHRESNSSLGRRAFWSITPMRPAPT